MLDAPLRRRTLLQIVTAGGVVALAPWPSGCGNAVPGGKPLARFLTPEEYRTLEALAEAIVPEGEQVGARGAHSLDFIDFLLAAFDNDPPPIYARGPFSGRKPFPAAEGGPSPDFPENDFATFRPLTRLQESSMRIELYGSESVPNGNINAPLVPAWPGLRAIYRAAAALATWADARGYTDLAAVPLAERLVAIEATSPEFRTAFPINVLQGMFAAPEYGGNAGGVAWRDYQWGGDSQPLGYTFYDHAKGTLRDNPEQPNQTRDPRWPGGPLEPAVEAFINTITIVQGGQRFF